MKKCSCGASYFDGSGRRKHCPTCAAVIAKEQTHQWQLAHPYIKTKAVKIRPREVVFSE